MFIEFGTRLEFRFLSDQKGALVSSDLNGYLLLRRQIVTKGEGQMKSMVWPAIARLQTAFSALPNGVTDHRDTDVGESERESLSGTRLAKLSRSY